MLLIREKGYQPEYHTFTIAATGTHFFLAKKFALQNFLLLKQFYVIGSGSNKLLLQAYM